MKLFYIILSIFLSCPIVAQVTITGSTGANGTYTNLTGTSGAFAAIAAAGAQTGNNIIITINANTSEDGTNFLTGKTWNSLTLKPGNSNIVCTGTGLNLLKLYTTERVYVDGLYNGANNLTFSNSNTNSISTIFIRYGTKNCSIKNCTITGACIGTSTGVVMFSNVGGVPTPLNSVSNNSIYNCTIGGNGVFLPTNAIYSDSESGSSNTADTIRKCLISDYFNATSVSAGILLTANNTNWVIDSCKFYQTASRTVSSGTNIHSAINLSNCVGDNFRITDNYIGGAAADGTGITTYGSAGVSTMFKAIIVNNVGPTIAALPSNTYILRNTIRGITINSGLASTTVGNHTFVGIELNNGTNTDSVICKNNIIGGISGIDSITINATATVTTNPSIGILNRSTKGNVIEQNTIGAITMSSTGSTTTAFVGIKIQSASTSQTIQVRNNTIGNITELNSLKMAGNSCQLIGIQSGLTSSAAIVNIYNNTIAGFTHTGANALGTSGSCIIGIAANRLSTDSDAVNVRNNRIFNLRNTISTNINSNIIGIRSCSQTGGLAVPGVIAYNHIYNLTLPTILGTSATVIGVQLANGNNHHVHNNMIGIGTGSLGNILGIYVSTTTVKIYHNSILISGTSSGSYYSGAIYRLTTNPIDAQNNIFYNTRTGNANNFSFKFDIGLSATFAYVGQSNYLQLNSINPIGNITGTSYYSFFQWQTALSSVAGNSENSLSKESDITFVSNSDLHSTDWDLVRSAINNLYSSTPAITIDIDGQNRSATCAPSVGADEVIFSNISTRNTWVGSSGDDRWCEPCLWDRGTIPTSTISAIIPSDLPVGRFEPRITSFDGCGTKNVDTIFINKPNGLLMASGSLNVYGGFYNHSNNNFTSFTGGALIMQGTESNTEVIESSASKYIQLYDLTFNRTNTTLINDTVVVTNITNLTDGIATIANNKMLRTNNLISGSSTSFVNTSSATSILRVLSLQDFGFGQLIPIGTSSTSYNPLIINSPPSNKPFNFSVVEGFYYTIAVPFNAINRTWFIHPDAPAHPTPISITFQYADAHANGGCSPIQTMELGGYFTGAWSQVSTPISNTPIGTSTARNVTFPVDTWVSAYVLGNVGSVLKINPTINLQIQQSSFSNIVKWEVNGGSNVNKYILEKSTNGINFISINEQLPNITNKYTFQDYNTDHSKLYYRIKALGLDNSTFYSPIRMVVKNLINSIFVAPSVVTNATTVHIYTSKKQTISTSVTDINGKVYFTKKVTLETGANYIDYDVSNLSSGIYVINLHGISKSLKFFKN
jgi:hypothetical protein